MELYNELMLEKSKLSSALKTLRQNGTALAQAEHDYKVELSKKVLQMRDDGMPATLINLVIYGEKDIARLRLNRDIAQTTYEANQEAINICKLKMRLIESQIAREWGSND